MPSPFYSTTARWALRYLLGTSNVSDIDAGFLALATDIDNLPLSLLPAATSGATATAVDGQMLNCTGAAQTVTLPASAKGMLGIRAGGTQTGANPVTITAAGGALIKGIGHSAGATSIALGTVGAAVVLLWDGANWLVIAGQQNTGWVALTLINSATAGGFFTPSVRLAGDVARFKGLVNVGSIQTFATLASAFRPTSALTLGIIAGGGSGTLGIATSGNLTGVAGASNLLDGLTYTLS